MKKCPFCAEEIQDEAKVCRHCGRDLEPPKQSAAENTKQTGCLLLVGLIIVLALVGWCSSVVNPPTPTSSSAFSEKSKTCGLVAGPTEPDVNRGLMFCDQGVAAGPVVGLIANESIVAIKVTREAADAMRRDRISAEQLVKTWMRGWRNVSGQRVVTVTVEWQDVEIAKGETTVMSGDNVTIR